MTDVFTSSDLFDIAMELEQTGQVFYETAAVACRDEKVADLCRRLARQEATHYKRFEQMRSAFGEAAPSGVMNPEDLRFVQSVINEQVIPDPAKVRELARKGTVKQTLSMAVKMEEDSIRFYTALLAATRGEHTEATREIIAEEERHVAELLAARKNLYPRGGKDKDAG